MFAIGDVAHVDDVPGVAQGALQEGTYVADVLTRRARGDSAPAAFHYRNKGNLAVVGRSWAVADIHGFKLSGRLAWLVWAFVHIAFLVGW